MTSISLSSSMSSTTKSVGNINLSTLIRISSIIPLGCFNDLSANCQVTVVGIASPSLSYLNVDGGINLMMAPKSPSAF